MASRMRMYTRAVQSVKKVGLRCGAGSMEYVVLMLISMLADGSRAERASGREFCGV